MGRPLIFGVQKTRKISRPPNHGIWQEHVWFFASGLGQHKSREFSANEEASRVVTVSWSTCKANIMTVTRRLLQVLMPELCTSCFWQLSSRLHHASFVPLFAPSLALHVIACPGRLCVDLCPSLSLSRSLGSSFPAVVLVRRLARACEVGLLAASPQLLSQGACKKSQQEAVIVAC